MSTHLVFIQYMEKVGYVFDADEEPGICCGFAYMAIQAMLLKEMKHFDKRLEVIFKDAEESDAPLSTIHDTLQQADIRAFLEGVFVYQEAHRYPELFERGKGLAMQNALSSAAFAASRDIEILGGLAEIDSFSGVYTMDELSNMFGVLKKIAHSFSREPFAVCLNSFAHGTSLSYDFGSDEWIFVDANTTTAQRTQSNEEMAFFITEAFSHVSEGDLNILTIILYSVGKHQDVFKEVAVAWRASFAWKKVNRLLDAKIASRDKSKSTWLQLAAFSGYLEEVKSLVFRGALVNEAEPSISPTLYCASQSGNLEMVRFLLEKGAAIDEKTVDKGESALYVAAECGYQEVVLLLLEKGAVMDDASYKGNTPLFIAAEYGRLEVVKLLLEKGADRYQENNRKETPLSVATEKGYLEIAVLLLHHALSHVKAATTKKNRFLFS